MTIYAGAGKGRTLFADSPRHGGLGAVAHCLPLRVVARVALIAAAAAAMHGRTALTRLILLHSRQNVQHSGTQGHRSGHGKFVNKITRSCALQSRCGVVGASTRIASRRSWAPTNAPRGSPGTATKVARRVETQRQTNVYTRIKSRAPIRRIGSCPGPRAGGCSRRRHGRRCWRCSPSPFWPKRRICLRAGAHAEVEQTLLCWVRCRQQRVVPGTGGQYTPAQEEAIQGAGPAYIGARLPRQPT